MVTLQTKTGKEYSHSSVVEPALTHVDKDAERNRPGKKGFRTPVSVKKAAKRDDNVGLFFILV